MKFPKNFFSLHSEKRWVRIAQAVFDVIFVVSIIWFLVEYFVK